MSRRVLLVEDDPDNREAMVSLLSLAGIATTATDCGAAALREFGAGDAFDLVLSDLDLPDMDGWAVAREIHARAPSMCIALITGWALEVDAAEVRRRGVDLVIKKPIDPPQFVGAIEKLLQPGGRSPSA